MFFYVTFSTMSKTYQKENRMKKITFLTILASILTNAQTVEPFYKLKPNTISNKECKSGKKATICLDKKFIYPTTEVLKKEIRDVLNIYIDKQLLAYKKENIQKYLDGVNLDEDDLMGGNYETINNIELFDYNKPIVSISNYSYQYTGGAHGNGGVDFINYSIKDKKEIKLNDILDVKNPKFLDIAQKEYKKSEKLLTNESLIDAGWFKDKFELSQNFAITSKGILFNYNAYEIKPYASGMTDFLLDYNKIKPFIKKKQILNIKKEKEPKIITKVNSTKNGSLMFTITKHNNGYYKIDIETSIYKDAKNIWFSLSFPNFKNTKTIKELNSSNTKSFKLYKIGSNLFSNKTKKTIKGIYPLLEAESNNTDFKLSFEVKKPKEMPYFCINYRVTMKNNTLFNTSDIDIYDQQGFEVQRICLE